MPISYLGMPLTIKKPSRHDFIPLLEKLRKRIAGWQGKFLSKGGRLQLIKSVLSSVPIYLMTSFFLPKWVLKNINQLCRNFLWAKQNGQGKGVHLINWEIVCYPKTHGGLGVPDLDFRNAALLLRWWWKLWAEKQSLWSIIITKIRGLSYQNSGLEVWMSNGSLFWNQLIKIKPLFHWCVQWTVGDGASISYWYDAWGGPPIRSLKDGKPRPRLQGISLRDMITKWPVVIPISIHNIPDFNDQEDLLTWRWSSDGRYTSASVYKTMLIGGKVKWQYMEIWRSYAPTKVQIFTFFLLNNRLLTHDNMLIRGIRCVGDCAMCSTCPLESVLHIFFHCQYAAQVWSCMGGLLVRADTIHMTWEKSWRRYKSGMHEKKRVWATRFMGVLWAIWKQRNEFIFRSKRMPPWLLARKIHEETELWIRCHGEKNKLQY